MTSVVINVATDETQWRDVLAVCAHDWYHSWCYHQEAQRNGEGEPHLFYCTVGQHCIAMPLLLRDIDSGGRDATSVYGYSGVIYSSPLDPEVARGFVQALGSWLFNHDVVSVFSRMHPILNEADSYFDESALHVSGKTVSIDLALDADEQIKQIRSNNRREIRKLKESGARCRQGKDLIDGFAHVYRMTMDRIEASAHYYFEDRHYQALLASDEFDATVYSVFSAEDKLMCSALFMFTQGIAQYHLAGTHDDYLRQAPAKLMLDKVREDALSRGCRYFHLGGGVGGREDSLYKFKRGFSKHTHEFCLLKWVVNRSRYNQLAATFKSHKPTADWDDRFFPVYRQ